MLRLPALALSLLLVVISCSDDSATPHDGAVADLSLGEDAAPKDGLAGDAPLQDAAASDGAAGDVGTASCDPGCQAEGTHLCYRDTNGVCQECDTSAHCLANPTALGPRCGEFSGKKYCYCLDSGDCENNPNSEVCYEELRVCACQTNADCPSGRQCTGLAGVISVCE